MSTLTFLSHLSDASRMDSPRPNLLSGFFHRLATEWRARQAVRLLDSLSEASLRDIGIARSEIDSAVRFGRHHRF